MWHHRSSPAKLFKNLNLDNTSKIHYPLHLHAINPDTGPEEPGTSYHPPPTRACSIHSRASVSKKEQGSEKADLTDLLTIPHNRLLRIRRLCKEFRIGRISPSSRDRTIPSGSLAPSYPSSSLARENTERERTPPFCRCPGHTYVSGVPSIVRLALKAVDKEQDGYSFSNLPAAFAHANLVTHFRVFGVLCLPVCTYARSCHSNECSFL